MEDLIQDSAGKGKTGSHSVDESSVTGKMTHNVPERNAFNVGLTSFFGSSNCIISGLPRHCLQLASSWQETESTKSSCSMEIHENDMICSSGKISPGCKSCGILDAVPANSDSMTSSTSSTFLKVKAEPSDMDDLHCPDMNSVDNTLPVKSELQTDDESCGDELDHMSLRDRIKLLVPEEASDLSISRKCKCLRKIEHSFVDYCSIVTECSKPININRPRKRKRSAT